MDEETNLFSDPENETRADNELLKLKLELEFGMKMHETSALNPEIENQWLRHIHDFEKQWKKTERIKVYDFIKRPPFRAIESLHENEISEALEQLEVLMCERGVSLECCCEYDPAVIYRFITVELFEEEMDNIFMEGGIHCFIYEEYYPNHDHEIRRKANDFIRSLYERKWDETYDKYLLSDRVTFGGKERVRLEIELIIQAFQESYSSFGDVRFEIESVTFDLKEKSGVLKGTLSYEAEFLQEKSKTFQGPCVLHFALDDDTWAINELELLGFGG